MLAQSFRRRLRLLPPLLLNYHDERLATPSSNQKKKSVQIGPPCSPKRSCEANGREKSVNAPKMTPKALPKRLLQRILCIFRPKAEFWEFPGGGGQRSRMLKIDGFASAGAHISESRLADPGDKYK